LPRPLEISSEFFVPYSQGSDPKFHEHPIPFQVCPRAILVNRTVQLDRELCCGAIEIDYKARDYLLPVKMKAVQCAPSDPVPEQTLCGRHVASQRLRHTRLFRIDALVASDGKCGFSRHDHVRQYSRL
jgi:hypothetical protein